MLPEPGLTSFIRRALLVILVFGLIGTGVELLLLKHTEGFWQLLPIAVTAMALAVVIWCVGAPSPAALATLQVIMVIFLIAGIIGVIQHFTGNIGYEKESNPGLGGADLYRAAAMGSTPLLAPGIMLQLGLIGLLYTFRHPAIKRRTS